MTSTSLPQISSYFLPQRTFPENSYHPLVEKYISLLTSNFYTFETIPIDDSVPKENSGIKTFDINNNIIPFNSSSLSLSPVGYVWKQLCDTPIVIGITKGIQSDHQPHYHNEIECYYVLKGKAVTLCNNQYIELNEGDFFYIPSNTIHNTPLLYDNIEFHLLYWFPNNSNFNTFQYYWIHNVTNQQAIDRFRQVDEIRRKELQLESYDVSRNKKQFKRYLKDIKSMNYYDIITINDEMMKEYHETDNEETEEDFKIE